jgi:hypothetical protein
MKRKDWAMRSVMRLLTGAVVGAIAVTAPTVRAQGTANPNQQTPPGWVFTPSLAVGGTWDDNVLLVNPGTTPPSDYGLPITPGASLDYTGKLTRFSSGYSGSFVRYASLDTLNTFQQSLRAMVEHRQTRRLTLFGQETFNSAPSTDMIQLAGVPFYRVGTRSNSAGGGAQLAVAKHTVLRGVYTLRSVSFDLSQFSATQLQGGHAHEVNASIEQTFSRHFSIGGEYQFTGAIVNSRTLAGAPGPQDRFDLQTGSVTAQYQAAAGTTVFGAIGVSQLGAGLTHQARTGPLWRAALAHRAGRSLISASYQRAYIPSFGFGGTFQNEQWAANIHTPIGHTRAYVDGGVSWYNNDPLDSAQPTLQTAWLSGSVGYYATRWLSLEGFYARTQQDSQRAGGQLDRNQVGFRVVAAKPVKLR